MIRRAPISTPFPYTTLFRSRPAGGDVRGARGARGRLGRLGGADGGRGGGARRAADPHTGRRGRGRDRKSTRLNSSHRCISYAVFCLKKKRYHVARAGVRKDD